LRKQRGGKQQEKGEKNETKTPKKNPGKAQRQKKEARTKKEITKRQNAQGKPLRRNKNRKQTGEGSKPKETRKTAGPRRRRKGRRNGTENPEQEPWRGKAEEADKMKKATQGRYGRRRKHANPSAKTAKSKKGRGERKGRTADRVEQGEGGARRKYNIEGPEQPSTRPPQERKARGNEAKWARKQAEGANRTKQKHERANARSKGRKRKETWPIARKARMIEKREE